MKSANICYTGMIFSESFSESNTYTKGQLKETNQEGSFEKQTKPTEDVSSVVNYKSEFNLLKKASAEVGHILLTISHLNFISLRHQPKMNNYLGEK